MNPKMQMKPGTTIKMTMTRLQVKMVRTYLIARHNIQNYVNNHIGWLKIRIWVLNFRYNPCRAKMNARPLLCIESFQMAFTTSALYRQLQ
jgi:hypothetical protein